MHDPTLTLTPIHDAYERWHGSSSVAVEFRRPSDDDVVPTEMSILFFARPLPNDDDVSLVATAGMSTRPMNPQLPRVELAFEVKGTILPGDRALIAKQLAELAVVPFREGRPFVPNLILDDVRLHPFAHMPCALLTSWELTADLFLPGLAPPVVLLRLTPLFAAEADVVERIGAHRAMPRFRRLGVQFEDYQRELDGSV